MSWTEQGVRQHPKSQVHRRLHLLSSTLSRLPVCFPPPSPSVSQCLPLSARSTAVCCCCCCCHFISLSLSHPLLPLPLDYDPSEDPPGPRTATGADGRTADCEECRRGPPSADEDHGAPTR